jgi:glutathione S-transferase
VHDGGMSQAKLHEITLYQDTHCPYSERARRVLSEKGIFQNRINVLWYEREELARKTGSQETPVAVYGEKTITNSGEIARFANGLVVGGVDLFPEGKDDDIRQWERRADTLAQATMPLAIPVWADVMSDSKDREAFLERNRRFGEYKDLKNRRLELWRQVESQWAEINEILAKTDYLLGPLTYADYAMYGSVYLAAQFHAFDVPQALLNLAAWYETIRTAGTMRDQEVMLGKSRAGHKTHDIDYTRGATRYGDPPHRPSEAHDETY